MPDDSKQPALNIGGNTVIIALLAAAGAYFVGHQVPLEDSRPPATEASVSERIGEQDIDARLWQDPFTAIATALTKSPELNPDNCNEKLKQHCQSPLNAPAPAAALNTPAAAPPLVLIVSVSAAPYAEDREFRRRTRYAVLAGLNAEGYVPEDPEHIGFYWPRASSGFELPAVLPFEWLKSSPRADMPPERVLLVWFNEDVLTTTSTLTPLKHFAHFLCKSLQAPTRATVKILGPQISTTLRAMVNEVEADPKAWSSGSCSAPPPFYVYSATTDDATLIPSYPSDSPCFKQDSCLTEFFAKDPTNIKLYRTISTDQALEDCRGNLLSCDAIQPAASTMAPEMSLPLATAFSVLGLCLVLSFRAPKRWTFAAVDKFMKYSKRWYSALTSPRTGGRGFRLTTLFGLRVLGF